MLHEYSMHPHGCTTSSIISFYSMISLVNFLNGRSRCRIISRRCSSCCSHIGHSPGSTGSSHSLKNRHGDSLKCFLLLFKFFLLSTEVTVQPLQCLIDSSLKLSLVSSRDLTLNLGRRNRSLEGIAVVLKSILSLNTVLVSIIFCLIFLSFLNHALDFFLRKTTLIVGDGDLVLLSGRLLNSRYIQDTVSINIEAHINLGLSTRHRRNSIKVELSKKVVITSHGTLTLENLNKYSWLVISIGGESLGLLSRYSSVSLDKSSHDSSCSLKSERKRCHIKKKKLRKFLRLVLARKDSCLYSSSISNSLIGVNRLAWFLSVEELRKHGLDLGDTGRSSYKYNLINFALLNVCICENTSNRAESLLEQIIIEFFKSSTGEGFRKIESFSKILDLQTSLLLGRKSTLNTLNLLTKLLKGTLICRDVNIVLLLHHLNKELHDTLIEILSSQVSISIGGKYFENSVINCKKSYIESSSTKIKDKNVGLSSSLVHSVCNSCSSWFVDNTLNLETRNCSSVLGSLTLSVIEVSRYCYNSVLDVFSKENLSSRFHLLQDHGRNFFGSEPLGLSCNSYFYNGLVRVGCNCIWYKLLISLNRLVREVSSDKTLHIENGIFRVDGGLILCSISHKTISVVHECDVGGCDTVTLIVGNNFNSTILENTDT
mmetsp:Transcript_2092/g.3811  ORF Transcript_2092/g.3811 Transcript_2092/m.3811 type:complete len:656 (-) Transcript_2092:222-2189(-)